MIKDVTKEALLKKNSKTSSTEYRAQSAEYGLQSKDFRVQSTVYRAQSAEHRALVVVQFVAVKITVKIN